MKPWVDILGTRYSIEIHESEQDVYLKEDLDGYCNSTLKLIVISDMSNYKNIGDKERELYQKETLRHELVHAILSESGLKDNALIYGKSWATNEEMVDFIACQFDKIYKIFEWCEVL